MSALPYADLGFLEDWARTTMTREPDFVIGEPANPYMRRWFVVPRNPMLNVYLHEILRSDDDRALHDHPWPNRSLLIAGSYVEHLPEGPIVRHAGDVVDRAAEAAHRLIVEPGAPVISLFVTGPKVRDWGFHCPEGWVPWQEFTAGDNGELIGRGCGEL
jgi:hypothetical protein